MSSRSGKRRNSDDEKVSPPPSKRALKQVSTTTKQAVQTFFTPASQKAKQEKLSWRVVESSLIIGRFNPVQEAELPSAQKTDARAKKVAAFDFDSTIIKPISNGRFAKDANDWCWWHGAVPGKLKSLHEEGYLLVILSNQSGISLRNSSGPKIKADRFTQFKQKAGAVFNSLNIPISIYAATEKDRFRKPMTGMWTEFLKDQNVDNVNLSQSVFVGDAGGRIAGSSNGQKYKADFACSDRNFAANVGIQYSSPEEFFLNQPAREFSRSFDPSLFNTETDTEAESRITAFLKRKSGVEMLVFVGSPGAGKSTFFRKYFQPLGYERVNQDKLKTRERCVKFAEERLSSGTSVVIDNTNPDVEVRKTWISLAQKFKIRVRCVQFTLNLDLAKHNDLFRAISGLKESNPESREVLPPIAFHTFAARFKEPQAEEGFEEILKVNFEFDGTDQAKEAWTKFSF